MIHVICPNCAIRFLVPETVQGRQGVCFGCGAPVRVPILSKPLDSSDLSLKPGTRLSERYVIAEQIGRGGMGVVYRAQDTLVNEEVALKLMTPKVLQTQKGQRNFIQEAQLARRLRHENIVAVHDLSWTDHGLLYITMEFLKGNSLRALLRKQRHNRRFLEVRLAVSITRQILTALQYAHRMVIHRDLKPENIMVLPGEHVKVLDFGLAKAVHDESAPPTPAPSRTPNRITGTWSYAAPEQRNLQKVDLRADLYTLGLIFHELLTLRTPMDDPVQVEHVRKDVSPSLLAVHDRALATEPQDRWPSSTAFRQALTEAFEQSYRAVSAPQFDSDSADAAASTEGMVYLEGGSFLMGCNDIPEEAPEFETRVSAFYMDKYPVTVEQYGQFLEGTGRPEPRHWESAEYCGPKQPVVGVTWEEANAYAAWAGKQLPTEAQWEFAARGRPNNLYPWGRAEPDTTWCNYREYLGMPSIVTMHEEGQTPEGICDLAGNVYEWTRDPFVPYNQKDSPTPDQQATPLCAVRGGCWNSPASDMRCSHRKGVFPESRLPTIGFRCVLPAQTEHQT